MPGASTDARCCGQIRTDLTSAWPRGQVGPRTSIAHPASALRQGVVSCHTARLCGASSFLGRRRLARRVGPLKDGVPGLRLLRGPGRVPRQSTPAARFGPQGELRRSPVGGPDAYLVLSGSMHPPNSSATLGFPPRVDLFGHGRLAARPHPWPHDAYAGHRCCCRRGLFGPHGGRPIVPIIALAEWGGLGTPVRGTAHP